jgi:hypothetical protein
MSEVYVLKSDRVNPNLLAAGGSLIVGDSAPRDGGDEPGEPKRLNANAVGAAQAPGASAVADKVTADQLHDLAQKAADRGDQQGSLALFAGEAAMRSEGVAKTSATQVAHAMARQAARYLKRQQMTSIKSTAAAPSNADVIRLLRTAAADGNWSLVGAIADKIGKRAAGAGNASLVSLCANLSRMAKARKG